MNDAGVIVRSGGEITLAEWLHALEVLDGIRVSARTQHEAEVFDSQYAEWVEAFHLADGRIEVRGGATATIARAAAALARQLGAIVSTK